jgi:hypothetical protein
MSVREISPNSSAKLDLEGDPLPRVIYLRGILPYAVPAPLLHRISNIGQTGGYSVRRSQRLAWVRGSASLSARSGGAPFADPTARPPAYSSSGALSSGGNPSPLLIRLSAASIALRFPISSLIGTMPFISGAGSSPTQSVVKYPSPRLARAFSIAIRRSGIRPRRSRYISDTKITQWLASRR